MAFMKTRSAWPSPGCICCSRKCSNYDASTLDAYDVVERGHTADFDPSGERSDLAADGFAWTNASFQIGLGLLDPAQRAKLAQASAGR